MNCNGITELQNLKYTHTDPGFLLSKPALAATKILLWIIGFALFAEDYDCHLIDIYTTLSGR